MSKFCGRKKESLLLLAAVSCDCWQAVNADNRGRLELGVRWDVVNIYQLLGLKSG